MMPRSLVAPLLMTPLFAACASAPTSPCDPSQDAATHFANNCGSAGHAEGGLDELWGARAPKHHHAHHHKQRHFKDAERWSRTFDAPERDAWQRPDAVIAALVPPGEAAPTQIVDVGAGTGYFTARLARAFPKAQVTAADIEESLLAWIGTRAADEGLTNVATHESTPETLSWPAEHPRADLVFLCNVYHHIEDRPAYFSDVQTAMHREGRLAIVDFRPESHRGPPPEHKLTAETVIDELESAGWDLLARDESLPDQYLLLFAPKASDP